MKYFIEDSTLTSLGDAVRSKTGGSTLLTLSQMVTEIENIPSGGGSIVLPCAYSNNSTINQYEGNEICIFSSAFMNCINLSLISFPNCVYIGDYAFHKDPKITTASFPECILLEQYVFAYCHSLTTVYLPKCTEVKFHCFDRCSSLTTVSLPQCTSIGSDAFEGCINLNTLSLPKVTTIGSTAFYYCDNLKSLYLTNSSFVGITNMTFDSSPFSAGGSGTIYVPSSMLASYYYSRPNWSSVRSKLSGI